MKHAINWFEIPSENFDRATAFYETLLGTPTKRELLGDIPNAILYTEQNERREAVGGSLVFNPALKPGNAGVVPYLNCDGKLDAVLGRVSAAGGTVVLPKVDTPFGSLAIIMDSEGNKIGLHSA